MCSRRTVTLFLPVPLEGRVHLLPEDRKQSLFHLFTVWCRRSFEVGSEKSKNKDIDVRFGARGAVSALDPKFCHD